MVTMADVTSSNVAQLGYDSTAMQLFVRFHNGKLYRYDGVPLSAWVEFKQARSIGVFLNSRIKPSYAATLLEHGQPTPAPAAGAPILAGILALVRVACRRPALF